MRMNRQFIEAKKFASKFILLIFILVIADFILGKFLNHYYFKIQSGSLYDVTYAIDSAKAETLVFGSSHASHDYDPEIFEKRLNTSFYNCGSDATGLVYEAALIKVVTHRYKPKRILMDILPYEFTFDESDRLAKLLPYHDNPVIYPYLLEKSPYEKFKLLSKSYPYNSLVTSIIVRNLRKTKETSGTKGYLALDGTISGGETDMSLEKGEIIQNKIDIYRNILDYLENLNIPIYIIISPIYSRIAPTKSEKIAKALCQKYQNIHFISFVNNIEYLGKYKLFYDYDHLNKEGAEVFSNELCTYIIKEETK